MANLKTLDVFFSAGSFNDEELRNKVIVIIDVLRASSTIVTALMNGAKGIIPVMDMGEASRISQSVDSDNILLCGEKDGIKIEGYDLGNSPFEYDRKTVEGKTLIFNTTNGTKAIKKGVGSAELYVAAFLNLSTVVEKLKNEQKDIVLVCAGWRGRLGLEDLLLAGNIIYKLNNGNENTDLRDGSKVALGIYEKYQDNIEEVILNSNHAARLKGLAGEEDINYCTKVDISTLLPVLKEGIITAHG